MHEELKLFLAKHDFDRRMKKVFVQNSSIQKINTFEFYLLHNRGFSCDGYAIMGLKNGAYLVGGEIDVSGRKHFKSWLEFKFLSQEFIFDSVYKCLFFKEEWYEEVKPTVKFKISKSEILKGLLENAKKRGENHYRILEIGNVGVDEFYIYNKKDIYKESILYMKGCKVKKFVAFV